MDKKTNVELKIFTDLKKCQNFVNSFCTGKKVSRKEIIPIIVGPDSKGIVYFIFIEYS